MSRLIVLAFSIAILLLSGCLLPPEPPNSQNLTQNTTQNTKPETQNLSLSVPLDKFSLWTNGTQLRGANIYQRIVYPDVYDDPVAWGNGPLGPNFTQDDFDALSAAGANLVVLSHPGLYDDRPPYAFDQAAQDNLDRYISMAKKANVFIVISFRTGPGRSEFTFFGVGNDTFGLTHLNDEVWKDEQAQDKWADMWKYTANRYKNEPNVIGYELMVEPNPNGVWLDIYNPEDFYPAYENSTYDWNQMYPNIISSIRQVDNETPILISPMSWSAVKWLNSLAVSNDSRIVYSVHQYEPQSEYTHQEYMARAKMNSYPSRLDTDGDGDVDNFSSAWFETYLLPVDKFKSDYGAQVAVTEFGLKRFVPGAANYIDDEMAAFEKQGLNYALWSWQPSSKGYNEAQNDFNFRLGPDPNNLSEGNSQLYETIKKYWKRNEIRPSDFGNGSG